jgi:hypothetical protein
VASESANKVGLADAAQNLISWKDAFTLKNLLTLASFVGESFSSAYDRFSDARTNAKMSGKLLAHYLASDNPTFQG